MSVGIKYEIRAIFNNCECREIDELVVVIQNMIQDLKTDKVTLDQLKRFFQKNKDAIIALMDICGIEQDRFDEIVRKIINLIARQAVFAIGGLLRKYSQFSEEEYIQELTGKKEDKEKFF